MRCIVSLNDSSQLTEDNQIIFKLHWQQTECDLTTATSRWLKYIIYTLIMTYKQIHKITCGAYGMSAINYTTNTDNSAQTAHQKFGGKLK